MKNVIKKIASIAMAFAFLGTGTAITKTISHETNTTIVANANSNYDEIGSKKRASNEYAQGMAMYNNEMYFVSETGNSNCKLYKKSVNSNSKPEEIKFKRKSDSNKIGHGNDLCVAKCGVKICLFVVDGQKRNNSLLKFELDGNEATLVAEYEFNRGISAVTLVNPDGTAPLKFIFRGGENISIAEIDRNHKNETKKNGVINKTATKIGTIKLASGAYKSQGICYFNGLLVVPYTFKGDCNNVIQVYGIDLNKKGSNKLENDSKPICNIWLESKKYKYEIEGIDYSNGNKWYFNTNEQLSSKGNYFSKFYYSANISNALSQCKKNSLGYYNIIECNMSV